MDIESKVTLCVVFTQSVCTQMHRSSEELCVNSFCNNGLMHKLPLMVSVRGRLDSSVCITTTAVVFPINLCSGDFSQTCALLSSAKQIVRTQWHWQ